MRASDVMGLVATLEALAVLGSYLGRPKVAFVVEGGFFCMCGSAVPFGTIHGHGVHALVVPHPKAGM